MANPEHLQILNQGVDKWNQWRRDFPSVRPNLSGVDLSENLFIRANFQNVNFRESSFFKSLLRGADLRGADLTGANLSGTEFDNASLVEAVLTDATMTLTDFCRAEVRRATFGRTHLQEVTFYSADLSGADFGGVSCEQVDFSRADLSGVNLRGATSANCNFHRANLSGADLGGANLSHSDLSHATLVETRVENTDFKGCSVYGISTWGLIGSPQNQSSLVISAPHEPQIVVDNLQVAQFVYFLVKNENIREVIETIGQKAVLILGRFTPERKAVLDAIAVSLRARGFLPIIFDFEKAVIRDFTETVKILAGLSLFVIADITNPSSSPLELNSTVPNYMLPFVPIIQENERPFSMFVDLQIHYDWVLPVLRYDTKEKLIQVLDSAVIQPALAKHAELVMRKSAAMKSRHIDDFTDHGRI